MHSVTVATLDLNGMQRLRVSSTKTSSYPVVDYRVEPYGIYYRITSDKSQANDWHTMQAHVLSNLHLQVSTMEWREGEGYDYDYYLDIVRVVETGKRWVVRDLYLDILVYEGRKVQVLDTDEYLEAVAEGHLGRAEAEHALNVTHDTLNALSKHGNSLEAYLKELDIRLEWT